jgi:hydrogenase small subunit
LRQRGVSRRSFLQFCASVSTMLALPAGSSKAIAAALTAAARPSVIWLSFQECTGCTETLTRSYQPTLESLILGQISLDYHHTLQAAAGDAAEQARIDAQTANAGKYILIVDGSISTKDSGAWSTISGISNIAMLKDVAAGAALIVALGTCASFGGLPAAKPNPTAAKGVQAIFGNTSPTTKKVVNVPGCPPIPEVIGAVITYYLTYGKAPALDSKRRPTSFYGSTIHAECPRKDYYEEGVFALSFDDAAARRGGCLYKLGCKGPVTHSACTSKRWNQGISFPIASGHGCIGCTEPGFWDRAEGMYGKAPAPRDD